MQKAADHFNSDYRTNLRHLDTNKSTIKNNKLILLFSKKLTSEDIKGIKVENVKNETLKIWVYTKVKDKFVLINKSQDIMCSGNQPTFKSKHIAAKELKISHKTIVKYLDTNNSYKDLFFLQQKFKSNIILFILFGKV
jgi:hypothetical protein